MSKTAMPPIFNEETGFLNVYNVAEMEPYFKEEIEKDLPSGRIFSTKKGRRALQGLAMIEEKYNTSWYNVVYDRWKDIPDNEAIFYRGNVISAGTMFKNAEAVSKALLMAGVEEGDIIGASVPNVPELLYFMLGANHISAQINFFGTSFAKRYMKKIVDGCTDKIFFVSELDYPILKDILEERGIKKIVCLSLADSLPAEPEKCPEYEPTLDHYYHYDNLAAGYAEENENVLTFAQFLALADSFEGEVTDNGKLDTDFIIAYTSGSTKIGYPKQVIHKNRGPITAGIFHDPELCGNPAKRGLRSIAHIHTEHTTDLVTTISDSLMQLWSVSMEPCAGRETFLEYLFVNKPNVVLSTTTFWVYSAKEYLIDGKFADRKLDFLLACMAVGEPCLPGEEKFLNTFLRKAGAGRAVKIAGPFSMPVVTMGMGGGDSEHGGIYYTLWRRMFEVLNKAKLDGRPYGLNTIPYAQAAVLAKNPDGTFTEAGYGEYGVIVANSATSMKGYTDVEKTKERLITDTAGHTWLSNDVFGYIDRLGCAHMKDRRDSKVITEDGTRVLPFMINDVVQKDTKNIMTSVITIAERDGKTCFVINLEFSPLRKDSENAVLGRLSLRLKHSFPALSRRFIFRVIPADSPIPMAVSGKRDVAELEKMGIKGTFTMSGGKRIAVVK